MELQVKHLCKRYGRKEALQDVSFTLQKGIYGLLGIYVVFSHFIYNYVLLCRIVTSEHTIIFV